MVDFATFSFEKWLEYVTPVSYTHLDVYKRQDKNIECVVSVGNVCMWYSDYLGDDSVGNFASVEGFETGEACEI